MPSSVNAISSACAGSGRSAEVGGDELGHDVPVGRRESGAEHGWPDAVVRRHRGQAGELRASTARRSRPRRRPASAARRPPTSDRATARRRSAAPPDRPAYAGGRRRIRGGRSPAAAIRAGTRRAAARRGSSPSGYRAGSVPCRASPAASARRAAAVDWLSRCAPAHDIDGDSGTHSGGSDGVGGAAGAPRRPRSTCTNRRNDGERVGARIRHEAVGRHGRVDLVGGAARDRLSRVADAAQLGP